MGFGVVLKLYIDESEGVEKFIHWDYGVKIAFSFNGYHHNMFAFRYKELEKFYQTMFFGQKSELLPFERDFILE